MKKINIITIKYYKLFLLCLIFIAVCFTYHLNNQTLNYILKRGVVLEYSLPYQIEINKDEIKNKLLEEKITYSYIENSKNIKSKYYDNEDKQISNLLRIAMPIQATQKEKTFFNNISDYIFNSYPNSKLIDIKALSDNYNKPFNSIIKFLNITIISLFFWIVLLYSISNDKNFFKNTKNEIIDYLNNKKNDFINFCKKTKEKGFGYFLKKILFDEVKDENGNEKEPDMLKEIISTIIFVIVCVIIIRSTIGEFRWIPSGSMRNTILEKDRVFVEKIDLSKKKITRGDILVFYPPETELKNDFMSILKRLTGIGCSDIAYIKRAVGVPNDKFEIKYNENTMQYHVYINDIALNEPYIKSKTDWTPCREDMHCGPFTIPENNYFMMGDNRGNSKDSRFWGLLPKDRIIGRANFMFWPLSRINILYDEYIELNKEKQGENYIKENYIINRYEFLYKI